MLGKLSSDSEQSENVEFRLGILERCVLTSMLGQLLPVIVTVLDGDKFCHIPVAKSLLPTVTSLTVMATKVSFTSFNVMATGVSVTSLTVTLTHSLGHSLRCGYKGK